MPDISKLTMSNGIVYNIKDNQAREDIEEIKASISSETISSTFDNLIEGELIHLISNAKKVDNAVFFTTDEGGGAGRYLKTVDLKEATSIGNYSFRSCINLTDIYMPKVIDIGEGAFENCQSLTSVYLPEIQHIYVSAFYGNCNKLKDIYIGKNTTKIDRNAFSGISSNAVINCGFAEGTVSGAPWDAPEGVTINYNVLDPINK